MEQKIKIINNPHLKKEFNIEEELNDIDNRLIQFDKPVDYYYLKKLNNVINDKKNISLRFYSYNGIWKKLDFLEALMDVKSIIIDEPLLESIEPITHLKKLKRFSLGYTDKKIDLNPLSFLNLESLTIEKNTLNLESILVSESIFELNLWNLSLSNTELLKDKILKKFTLNNVRLNSLDFLNSLKVRNQFSLYNLNQIEDLDFISNSINLKNIDLVNLNKVKKLFYFDNLIELQTLSLDNLKGLTSLSDIGNAKSLEKLYIYVCPKLSKSELNKVLKLPSVEVEHW